MNMMEIIVLGVILITIGGLFIWKPWEDNKIDLTHKDEAKLSEEGTYTPENVEVIKEVLAKKPRSNKKVKKPQQVDNCTLVDIEIAEKPVRKQVKK